MRELTLHLPEPARNAEADDIGWLLLRIGAHPMVQMIQSGEGNAEIGMGVLCYPLTAINDNRDGLVAIAPGAALAPTNASTLLDFLRTHWQRIDHIGFNISEQDMAASDWERLIDAIAQSWPAYRLNIGSRNDIVMLVHDGGLEGTATVELVYDRAVHWSNMHICVAVDADRAGLEAAFPEPFGAYKPGDERFFRSVAPQQALPLPVYIDLAFTDGDMMPWTNVVHTMGTRIG